MTSKNRKPDEFHFRPFDRLRKNLENARKATKPLPAVPIRVLTEDEEFHNAMNDVQMIREFRVLPCTKSVKRAAPERRKEDADGEALAILEQIASGRHPINLSDTQEYVEWTNPDFRSGLSEELHSGRFSIQAMLDLHGYTGDEVNEELDHFLTTAFRRGWQCVKIIHGRGLRSVNGPILKDAVIRRLSGHYRKDVIAFVSARQCDGGLGALYVLIKKR